MGYGLIDIGAQTRNQAMQGMQDAAEREENREAANKQLRAARTGQTMGAIGAGASVGGMVGGPIGVGVGALGGFILSKLF